MVKRPCRKHGKGVAYSAQHIEAILVPFELPRPASHDDLNGNRRFLFVNGSFHRSHHHKRPVSTVRFLLRRKKGVDDLGRAFRLSILCEIRKVLEGIGKKCPELLREMIFRHDLSLVQTIKLMLDALFQRVIHVLSELRCIFMLLESLDRTGAEQSLRGKFLSHAITENHVVLLR